MNKRRINVLVTGVGGNIGQGIVKALRMSLVKTRIIGTDMNPLSSGLVRVDKGFVVKSSDHSQFMAQMIRILQKEKIDILFVGSDVEVDFFSKNKEEIENSTNCFVLVSSEEVSRIGYDKWATYCFCKNAGIAAPESVLPENRGKLKKFLRKNGFPVVIKPRIGYGSRNVVIVHNAKELEVFLKRIPNAIVQAYVGTEESEYTAASFMDEEQEIVGTIIFRRLLSAGATYKAEVVENKTLCRKVEAIVQKIAPLGPCNIQFRLVKGEPIPIEFNIRFSGTTPMRAALGFNDVEMALRHFVLGERLKKPLIKKGVIFRYWNEVLIPGKVFKDVQKSKNLSHKHSTVLSRF